MLVHLLAEVDNVSVRPRLCPPQLVWPGVRPDEEARLGVGRYFENRHMRNHVEMPGLFGEVTAAGFQLRHLEAGGREISVSLSSVEDLRDVLF